MYSTNFGIFFMFLVSHGPFLVLFLQKYLAIQEEEPWVLCISMTCTASSHWSDTGRGLAIHTGNIQAAIDKNLKKSPKIPGVHVPHTCTSHMFLFYLYIKAKKQTIRKNLIQKIHTAVTDLEGKILNEECFPPYKLSPVPYGSTISLFFPHLSSAWWIKIIKLV